MRCFMQIDSCSMSIPTASYCSSRRSAWSLQRTSTSFSRKKDRGELCVHSSQHVVPNNGLEKKNKSRREAGEVSLNSDNNEL